jgi:hypothetical protein
MPKTTERTSFTRDIQGRYLCNDISEANAWKTQGTLLWDESGHILSHAGGRPTRAQPASPGPLSDERPSPCVVRIALRPKEFRHSDVLMAARGEGECVVDRRLDGRPLGARSRFHLTPESFIK